MAKFNPKRTIADEVTTHKDVTLNYEGGIAYTPSMKTELMLRAACTMIGEPKFYQSARDSDSELVALTHRVIENDPEFVLKLAAYCRNELYLRSVPIVLLVEYANSKHVGSIPDSRKYVDAVVQRADDMTEMLAYQFARNQIIPRIKTKVPQLIEKGLRDTFGKFDAYQLAKYNRPGTVTLKDVVFIAHPKPNDPKHALVMDQLVNDRLPPAETWEVALSATDGRTKKEKWEAIISRMGYMATLRNLRNMLLAGVDMSLVWDRISNPDQVKKSKQMPFRFFSAYREIEKIGVANIPKPADVPKTLDALEEALELSISHIPKLTGTTLVAADTSGSMTGARLSAKSVVTCADVAVLFASMSRTFCENAIVGEFADYWNIVNLPAKSSIFDNMSRFGKNGGATYGYKILNWLLQTGTKVDRLLIFSDFQVYNERPFFTNRGEAFAALHTKYVREVNPKLYTYSVDLQGYGTTMLPEQTKNTALVAGWSDRIFDFIKVYETPEDTMIKTIEGYRV